MASLACRARHESAALDLLYYQKAAARQAITQALSPLRSTAHYFPFLFRLRLAAVSRLP
jgi:hypothetical protein